MKNQSDELLELLLDGGKVVELDKPVTINIKPYTQGLVIYGHTVQPTYGITRITSFDGEIAYIVDHEGKEIYIPQRWVLKRVLSN